MPEIALGRVISGAREISRDTLMERAACAATGLGELGLGAGDAVGIVLRNDFAFFESSYAAQRLGAYSVLINWHSKTQEIAYVLNDCGAKAVVAHADLLLEVVPAMPSGVPLFVVPTPPEIAAAYGIAAKPCRPPPDALEWDDLAISFPPVAGASAGGISSMIYTSGTTGNPKGVRRLDIGGDPAQLRTFLMDKVFGIAPDRVVRTVITGPLYHSAPNAYGLYAVRMGGLAVLQPSFDAAELLRLIEQYRITHLHMVPTMFVRLLRLPEEVKRKYDLSSSTAPRKRSRSPAPSAGHCPVARSGSTMPMAEPCLRVRWVRSTFGSRAFPISPITAWTTSATRSGATAWSLSATSAISTRTAISSSVTARATW